MNRRKTTLISKYLKQFSENPRSYVFAPLAEAYRNLGMYDEAYETLKKGLSYHPDYLLAHIVFANCLFDQKKFERAYKNLKPYIAKNTDNIALQKLFAQICEKLGYLEEALNSFKYLLFVNPKDRYFAEQVQKLEQDLTPVEIESDNYQPRPINTSAVEEWQEQDFSPKDPISDPLDQWQPMPVQEDSQMDSPFVTHTLVDIFCSQGHYEKALEVLEKILELNPGDQKTLIKLEEVKTKHILEQARLETGVPVNNQLTDQRKSKEEKAVFLLNQFLTALQKKSQQFKNDQL